MVGTGEGVLQIKNRIAYRAKQNNKNCKIHSKKIRIFLDSIQL